MPLDKMRRARHLTQIAIAQKLKVDQGSVSKLENWTDVDLSNLREYVQASSKRARTAVPRPDARRLLESPPWQLP